MRLYSNVTSVHTRAILAQSSQRQNIDTRHGVSGLRAPPSRGPIRSAQHRPNSVAGPLLLRRTTGGSSGLTL